MIITRIKKFVKNRDQQSWTKVEMKVRSFIDRYQADIILVIGVILISLLSFAVGYIVAKEQGKESLNFEHGESSYYRSGNQWTVSRLEIV